MGEEIFGNSLTYIKNELSLIESIEYLDKSPLNELILKPAPQHFKRNNSIISPKDINSQVSIIKHY